MTEITRILNAIDQGDTRAADQLLPLVYEDLRRLAAQRLSQENPGQTLQATALVHEAYLRLVGSEDQHWDSRCHFFTAAAEAMRRILVDRVREKDTQKHGGNLKRLDFEEGLLVDDEPSGQLLALDDALRELELHDAEAAKLVKLRYFAGLTHHQAAQAMGIGRRTADRVWALARAWLYQQLSEK